LEGAMQQLEENSTVDYLVVPLLPDMTVSILDELYTAVLHHIRTRKQFRKFSLFIDDDCVVHVNLFLMAASENSGLQSLDLGCAIGYTAETLGRFNLRQLHFRVSLDFDRDLDLDQDIIHGFKQIIETCPKMQHVDICLSQISQNTLGPICEAL
jgi:hypothetical protein